MLSDLPKSPAGQDRRLLILFFKRTLDRKYVSLVLVLLIAFALRMWDIDARSLWFDEAFEYWSANVDFAQLYQTVLTAYQPPLYTYLLHLWLNFGIEAIWLRFLSVVLSMLGLVGMLTWGCRLFGLRGALVAGIIMAVLPPEIRYAQEAAEYALMECLLVWGLNFLHYTFKSPSWKIWVSWGLLSVLSVCSHYGATIVVISVEVITFLENLLSNRKDNLSRQVAIALFSIMLAIPILAYFLPNQIRRQLPVLVPSMPFSMMELEKFVLSMGDTFLFHLVGWPFSSLPKWLGQTVIYVILAFSVVILIRSSSEAQRRTLVWFLGTYVAYFVTVEAGLYAYGNYGFRYALILSPLFILVATAVINQFVQWKRTLESFVLLLTIVGLAVYSLPNRTVSQVTRGGQPWPETEDLREVTECWIEYRNENAITYVYYGALPAFRYYIRLYGLESNYPLPPTWYSSCWAQTSDEYCSSNGVFYGEWFRSFSPEEKRLSIQRTLGHMPEQFWLIFSHVSGNEDEVILRGLSETYTVIFSCEKVNASAYLLNQR
ncbi:MAG: hypothetical protein DRI79_13630 [Chloroflexi bacterium]|nr:MAG: hypothetical protein DRI79_13630 [Chloroflexota bacterium]